MSILAVDFGFGNIKWKTQENRGILRSVYAKSKNGLVFGKDALTMAGTRNIQTVADLISLYPVFINYFKDTNKFECSTVAVGLPLESFLNQNLKVELHDSILYGVKGINNVFVYPQAMSVAVANGDGLVIDIGHNTVLACLVKQKKPVWHKSYFQKGSMDIAKSVYEYIRPELAMIGKSLNTVEMDEVVVTGKIQLGFDLIDLTDTITATKQQYINDTIKYVVNDLKTTAGIVEFDTVYLIGGIAKDIQIKSSRVKVVVPDEPIFANVDAFYQLGMLGITP